MKSALEDTKKLKTKHINKNYMDSVHEAQIQASSIS